jgi:hypothetical protein
MEDEELLIMSNDEDEDEGWEHSQQIRFEYESRRQYSPSLLNSQFTNQPSQNEEMMGLDMSLSQLHQPSDMLSESDKEMELLSMSQSTLFDISQNEREEIRAKLNEMISRQDEILARRLQREEEEMYRQTNNELDIIQIGKSILVYVEMSIDYRYS